MDQETKDHSTPWKGVPPGTRLLRVSEICERTQLSRSQIYALVGEGKFPPLIKLSPRVSALPEAWLDAFIKSRALRVNAAADHRGVE